MPRALTPFRSAQSMSLGWPGGQPRMAPAYASRDSSSAPARSDAQSLAASEGPTRRSSWYCLPALVHLKCVRRERERGPPPDRVLWKLGVGDASPAVCPRANTELALKYREQAAQGHAVDPLDTSGAGSCARCSAFWCSSACRACRTPFVLPDAADHQA